MGGWCFAIAFLSVTGLSMLFAYRTFYSSRQFSYLEVGWSLLYCQAVGHWIGAWLLRSWCKISNPPVMRLSIIMVMMWILLCPSAICLDVPMLSRVIWCMINAFCCLHILATTLLLKRDCLSLLYSTRACLKSWSEDNHRDAWTSVGDAVKRWQIFLTVHVLLQLAAIYCF